MAILDMYGRRIEAGDVIMITSGKVQPVQVLKVEEPSTLTPPNQMPVGKMSLAISFDQPIINPQRTPNLTFQDIVIVRKFSDFEAPEGTPKQ